MVFGRKKKEEVHKGDVFLAKGIYLKKPRLKNGHVLLNCFLRSLIVFMLVFGSVGGFLSAFDITYNYFLVIVAYLLLSTYFSFLYSTSKMLYRDLGYIGFFVFFVWTIITLRRYANSGFYVIVNRVLKYAQTFFDLSGVREYDVMINRPYITVAIVAIFIGMVEIIILNIWIYSTMSLGWTLLFTFPVLFIPIYMKYMPDSFFVALLCAGYLAVVVFKANGHYLSFAWDASFKIRGLKKNQVSYTQDVDIFKQIIAKVLLASFCLVMAIHAFFPEGKFSGMFKDDKLRENTSEFIGNALLLGFGAWYNRYSSTGGMNGGKLGGVANIHVDYQPDLLVSFAPYGNDAIYLKAYTGGIYGDNQWESIYGNGGDDIEIFEDESLKKEVLSLQNKNQRGERKSGFGFMDIKNVGADSEYLYYPYYTLFDDYSIYANHSLMPSAQGLKIGDDTTYLYYPQINWNEELENVIPSQMDKSAVDEKYLDVPEKNKEIIRAECDKIGLNENMTEKQIVDLTILYFYMNIPYTIRPGSTPKNEDFINYFLTKNRKGYCAHFASTATLIFREMGIPARYVEGYAFSMETVLTSEINEKKNYKDYYWGYSEIGDSAVMDVEVTDAMAHAWVEIYVDGFGWKVVEVTPGSNESTDESNFWDAFAGLLDIGDDNQNDGNNIFNNVNLEQYSWTVYIIISVIVLIWIAGFLKLIYRKIKRYMKCHQENMAEALIARYADICDIIRMYEPDYNLCRNHIEQLSFIEEKYEIQFEKEKLSFLLEYISYSRNSIETDNYRKLEESFVIIKKAIWKHITFMQKIKWLRR